MTGESHIELKGTDGREWPYRPLSTSRPAWGTADLCRRSLRGSLLSRSTEPSSGVHGKSHLEILCDRKLMRFVHHTQLSRWLPQTAVPRPWPGHRIFLKSPILTRTAS